MSTTPGTTPMAIPDSWIESIDPATAHGYLARNASNRPLRSRVVRAYARDMARGVWRVTGEPIKFDRDGNLLDGQHRLAAAIEADCEFTTLVVSGLDPETQTVMDSGAKRQVTDNLDMMGKTNTRVLAAAARLALVEPGMGFVAEGKAAPTHTEIIDFIDAYGEELESAVTAAKNYVNYLSIPSSVMTLVWMRLVEIDHEAAREFFDSIKNQTTGGLGDPRLALARRLASRREQRSRLTQREYASLIFRAWNAWRLGRTVRSLPVQTRGGEIDIPERLR